jgi:hypothetical protein
MAQCVLRGTSPDRSPTELVVTVSAEVLRDPATAPEPVALVADGTCVSAETARRLACDCGVVHLHHDADGEPLSIGRKTRTIPISIKRALLRRDRTCRFPGCQNWLFVEGHHITHWANGGETSLDNLVGLCGFHHRFVHEGGYTIELRDGAPIFHDERGRLVRDAPPPPRLRDLGWPAIRARTAEYEITAETNECLWDGHAVQYGMVIDSLLYLDA